MALRLARYFGTSPDLRLGLQAGYDLFKAKLKSKKMIDEIKPHAKVKAATWPNSSMMPVYFLNSLQTLFSEVMKSDCTHLKGTFILLPPSLNPLFRQMMLWKLMTREVRSLTRWLRRAYHGLGTEQFYFLQSIVWHRRYIWVRNSTGKFTYSANSKTDNKWWNNLTLPSAMLTRWPSSS